MDIEKSFSHITPTRNSDEAVVSKSTAQKLTSKEISDNLVVNLMVFLILILFIVMQGHLLFL